MTENNGRGERTSGGSGPSPDLVDDALRLVDGLQRKLLAAGVRRGVGAVTAPPSKGDVWEEAIRLETEPERPALSEVLDIVRTSAPQIAGHLGRAGLVMADALGRTWDVVERSLERPRDDTPEAGRRR
ncbi:hypothetical protein BJF83_09270 [Nocardiopsis sp. CNR-923]|uniref:hypothetical protein n=1 Tax=Nocardiopsis sp. CNR-923 TaxID=1904965 RepID=UPI00095AF6D0|nr:hypothetical protein [Nocardiopsis sp. CNR-923]OLT30139.1 hypothetical protein BJF83_09270 [Nocardiopsis sp. CNR-923]